jgi:hypothetical protein
MFYKNDVRATQISWTPPTEYTDGSAYGSSDHAGYELGVLRDGQIQPHISVPATYDVTSWPLNELNLVEYGDHEIALRTVTQNSIVSAWSTTIVVENRDEREPTAPVNFSAA